MRAQGAGAPWRVRPVWPVPVTSPGDWAFHHPPWLPGLCHSLGLVRAPRTAACPSAGRPPKETPGFPFLVVERPLRWRRSAKQKLDVCLWRKSAQRGHVACLRALPRLPAVAPGRHPESRPEPSASLPPRWASPPPPRSPRCRSPSRGDVWLHVSGARVSGRGGRAPSPWVLASGSVGRGPGVRPAFLTKAVPAGPVISPRDTVPGSQLFYSCFS